MSVQVSRPSASTVIPNMIWVQSVELEAVQKLAWSMTGPKFGTSKTMAVGITAVLAVFSSESQRLFG